MEIVRLKKDMPHSVPGEYVGPFPSGAPAIFADAAARLGAPARFMGSVGDDAFGDAILNQLESDGVSVRWMKTTNVTTGVAFVAYFSDGSRKFVYHLANSAAGSLRPEDVSEDFFAEAALLLVMGTTLVINDTCREACYKAVKIARTHDLKIGFDPNIRPELLGISSMKRVFGPLFEAATFVMPSIREATYVTERKSARGASNFFIDAGAEVVAIKKGENGSEVFTANESFDVPAFEVKETDPTGAGDVYDAAFLLRMMEGSALRDAAVFANASGAIKVTRIGPMAGPRSRSEVERLVKRGSIDLHLT